MLIERVWADNAARNFHYLVACEVTGEALAIDPLNWQAVLARAQQQGWRITQILNTHEHWDHIGGNEPLRAATGARLLAHAGAVGQIVGVDRALTEGDVITVGSSVRLNCLDTPGHTLSHLCAFFESQPALFCGDTLFNAGAGNCHNGGDPALLYETFRKRLTSLPPDTRIFPGHEYFARNLGFSLSVEPSNAAAAALLERCSHLAPEEMPITTLAQEFEVNPFFRLQQPEIIEATSRSQPQAAAPAAGDAARAVFLALRALRNHW
jgi:hydroxyacylglutathione hydrolase